MPYRTIHRLGWRVAANCVARGELVRSAIVSGGYRKRKQQAGHSYCFDAAAAGTDRHRHEPANINPAANAVRRSSLRRATVASSTIVRFRDPASDRDRRG